MWDEKNPDFPGIMPLVQVPQSMAIHNGRERADLRIETSSFELIQFAEAPDFTDLDFNDEAEVKRRYYPAIEHLVREYCGFDFVAAVGHVARSELGGEGGDGNATGPHHDIHNDFTVSEEQNYRPPKICPHYLFCRLRQTINPKYFRI